MNKKFLINLIKAALFMALLAPFIKNTAFYFPFVGLKGIYFMAVAEAAFFLWIVLAWSWKEYRPSLKNPLLNAIMIFVAVSFVSAVAGADFSASFWSKFERMSGILLFSHLAAVSIVSSLVFEKSDWKWFFFASIIAALVVGVEALFGSDPNARAGGFIGNDSFLGSYLIFNIFIALYLAISQKWRDSKWLKISAAAAFAILSFCLLFEGTQFWTSLLAKNPQLPEGGLLKDMIGTGARAAKVSLAGGLFFLGLLWLSFCKNVVAKIVGRTILAIFAFGAVATAFFSTQPGNEIYRAMESRFSESTVHGRIVVWEIAWKGFLDRPVLGWGPENFDLAFARHYNPCLGTVKCAGELWYDRAHNIVFDTLATTGIFGLISYLAIFGVALYVLWKKYFSGAAGFAEAGVFTALLAAYFAQNLTVFDMLASLMMFFLVLGFIASRDNPGQKNEERRRPLSFWKTVAIVLAFAVCFQSFVIGPYNADRSVILAAQSPLGSQSRLDYYKRTFDSSPLGEFQIRLFFAQKWLEAVQGGAVSQLNSEQINREFSFVVGELEKSRAQVALDFKSRLLLGQLYNSWSLYDHSKTDLADKVLSEALALAPQNQQTYWHLAQTRLYQMRIDDAFDLAQAAYDLYPDNAQSQTVLGEIKAIRDKIKAGQQI